MPLTLTTLQHPWDVIPYWMLSQTNCCTAVLEVQSEDLSLKDLLSQMHSKLQASMPQWTPHFAIVCRSLYMTDTVFQEQRAKIKKTRAFGSC